MTPMPRAKLASLPSRRVVTPRARLMNANTRHATGRENFWWISMISLCAESSRASSSAACARSSPILISANPRCRPPAGKISSGSSPSTISSKRLTL